MIEIIIRSQDGKGIPVADAIEAICRMMGNVCRYEAGYGEYPYKKAMNSAYIIREENSK